MFFIIFHKLNLYLHFFDIYTILTNYEFEWLNDLHLAFCS